MIANEYGLSDRASVYRHAHAFSLFEKRSRNVRAALERIIEKAGEVEVTSSAVVSAVHSKDALEELARAYDGIPARKIPGLSDFL